MFVTEPNDGPAEVPVPRGQGLWLFGSDTQERRELGKRQRGGRDRARTRANVRQFFSHKARDAVPSTHGRLSRRH